MKLSTVKKSAIAGLLWACASMGQAGVVTQTLGDYSTGDDLYSTWPVNINVGQFSFDMANMGNIISATISGTFGNGFSNTSTEVYVFADNLEVAYCSLWDDCATNGVTAPPEAWSYTFSGAELALFADGVLNISFSKEYDGWVNLGGLTLEIVNDVPEPASAALLLAGLAGLGLVRRKRLPQA